MIQKHFHLVFTSVASVAPLSHFVEIGAKFEFVETRKGSNKNCLSFLLILARSCVPLLSIALDQIEGHLLIDVLHGLHKGSNLVAKVPLICVLTLPGSKATFQIHLFLDKLAFAEEISHFHCDLSAHLPFSEGFRPSSCSQCLFQMRRS